LITAEEWDRRTRRHPPRCVRSICKLRRDTLALIPVAVHVCPPAKCNSTARCTADLSDAKIAYPNTRNRRHVPGDCRQRTKAADTWRSHGTETVAQCLRADNLVAAGAKERRLYASADRGPATDFRRTADENLPPLLSVGSFMFHVNSSHSAYSCFGRHVAVFHEIDSDCRERRFCFRQDEKQCEMSYGYRSGRSIEERSRDQQDNEGVYRQKRAKDVVASVLFTDGNESLPLRSFDSSRDAQTLARLLPSRAIRFALRLVSTPPGYTGNGHEKRACRCGPLFRYEKLRCRNIFAQHPGAIAWHRRTFGERRMFYGDCCRRLEFLQNGPRDAVCSTGDGRSVSRSRQQNGEEPAKDCSGGDVSGQYTLHMLQSVSICGETRTDNSERPGCSNAPLRCASAPRTVGWDWPNVPHYVLLSTAINSAMTGGLRQQGEGLVEGLPCRIRRDCYRLTTQRGPRGLSDSIEVHCGKSGACGYGHYPSRRRRRRRVVLMFQMRILLQNRSALWKTRRLLALELHKPLQHEAAP
ncbi:unnamed protein product, partial [Rangifer tarandus platyrhynchus]